MSEITYSQSLNVIFCFTIRSFHPIIVCLYAIFGCWDTFVLVGDVQAVVRDHTLMLPSVFRVQYEFIYIFLLPISYNGPHHDLRHPLGGFSKATLVSRKIIMNFEFSFLP